MDISLISSGIEVECVSAPRSILLVPPSRRTRLLLRQCCTGSSEPIVERGQEVAKGQLVAEGANPIHSPIAGVVRGVEEIPWIQGDKVRALVIEADDSGRGGEWEPDPDVLTRPPAVLLERIRKAGVVQDGRETQCLAALLDQARGPRGTLSSTGKPVVRPVRHLVVRCTDVEPHMASQRALAWTYRKDATDIGVGVDILLRVTEAEHVHVVLSQSQSVPALEALCEERDWELVRVPDDHYPAAHATLLAARVSGHEPNVAWRRVHESGSVVLDLETVIDVTVACRNGKPMTARLVTVYADGEAKVLLAPLGTSYADIAQGAGYSKDFTKAIVGGPLDGLAYHSLDFPLAKNLPGLTLQSSEEVIRSSNQPCISCGLCTMVCPMRLVPGLLSRYCEFGKWSAAEAAHLFTCIECGCCAYVCPAHRSIVQLLILGKDEILATRRSS